MIMRPLDIDIPSKHLAPRSRQIIYSIFLLCGLVLMLNIMSQVSSMASASSSGLLGVNVIYDFVMDLLWVPNLTISSFKSPWWYIAIISPLVGKHNPTSFLLSSIFSLIKLPFWSSPLPLCTMPHERGKPHRGFGTSHISIGCLPSIYPSSSLSYSLAIQQDKEA
jgi:hypothetical protein